MNTSFISDCENWVLEKKWTGTPPKGKDRLTDNWKNLIIEYTEVQLEDYIQYVMADEGDEWFVS